MIRPPGFSGVAFGTALTGDLRSNRRRRVEVAQRLGVTPDWAYVHQVHGAHVVLADRSGHLGDGDAIVTTTPGLPITVATADCAPIVIEAAGAVAVVHAGWRGAAAGIVPAVLDHLVAGGHPPRRAAIGPAIGPCCYEVGEEVATRFAGFTATTTWGSPSIDIPGFVASQLADIELWRSPECTFTSDRLHSWRKDHTKRRQITVAWLPTG
jgi:YfiH family protein